MNVFTEKKQIVIDYRGDIPVLNVAGPIDIPYWETLEHISQMLMYNVRIYEVLSDGSKVELDLCNYDKENDPKKQGLKQAYEPVTKDNPTRLVTDKPLSISEVTDKFTKPQPLPPTKMDMIDDTNYESMVTGEEPKVISSSATIREESNKKQSKKLQKANKIYVPPTVDEVDEK